jgi:hypothetical protein
MNHVHIIQWRAIRKVLVEYVSINSTCTVEVAVQSNIMPRPFPTCLLFMTPWYSIGPNSCICISLPLFAPARPCLRSCFSILLLGILPLPGGCCVLSSARLVPILHLSYSRCPRFISFSGFNSSSTCPVVQLRKENELCQT